MKTATRKPARSKSSRPTRTVKVIEAMTAEIETLTVRVTEGDKVDLYDVTAGTVAGRYNVWLWRKVLGTVSATCAQTPYIVDVGNEFGPSCSCKGYQGWGHCRHVSATLALVANGKLPVCETCHGRGGPAFNDTDSDGCCCRSCGA